MFRLQKHREPFRLGTLVDVLDATAPQHAMIARVGTVVGYRAVHGDITVGETTRWIYRVYFPAEQRVRTVSDFGAVMARGEMDPAFAERFCAVGLQFDICDDDKHEESGYYLFATGQHGRFRFRHGEEKPVASYQWHCSTQAASLGEGFLNYQVPITTELNRSYVRGAFAALLGVAIDYVREGMHINRHALPSSLRDSAAMLEPSIFRPVARLGTRVLIIDDRNPSAESIAFGKWGTIVAVHADPSQRPPLGNGEETYRVYRASKRRDRIIRESKLLISAEMDEGFAAAFRGCTLWVEAEPDAPNELFGSYQLATGQLGEFRFRTSKCNYPRYKFRHTMHEDVLGDGFLDYQAAADSTIDRSLLRTVFAELLDTSPDCILLEFGKRST